jgi:hypothetical protein
LTAVDLHYRSALNAAALLLLIWGEGHLLGRHPGLSNSESL